MSNEARSTNDRTKRSGQVYDLEERTAQFGEAIIALAKRIPIGPTTAPLIDQLVRAGTSAGANYCEADDAGSGKEFKYRISICKREAREAKHWLRMIAAAVPGLAEEARHHWREPKELHLIFAAIFRGKKARDTNLEQQNDETRQETWA